MIAANVLLRELLVNFATTAQSFRNSEALHGTIKLSETLLQRNRHNASAQYILFFFFGELCRLRSEALRELCRLRSEARELLLIYEFVKLQTFNQGF